MATGRTSLGLDVHLDVRGCRRSITKCNNSVSSESSTRSLERKAAYCTVKQPQMVLVIRTLQALHPHARLIEGALAVDNPSLFVRD